MDVDITITYIKHLIELLNYDVSDVLYAAVVHCPLKNLLSFQTLGLVCWLSLPLFTGVSQAGQVNPFSHVIIEHELIILHMLSDSIYEKAFQLFDDYSLILSFLLYAHRISKHTKYVYTNNRGEECCSRDRTNITGTLCASVQSNNGLKKT